MAPALARNPKHPRSEALFWITAKTTFPAFSLKRERQDRGGMEADSGHSSIEVPSTAFSWTLLTCLNLFLWRVYQRWPETMCSPQIPPLALRGDIPRGKKCSLMPMKWHMSPTCRSHGGYDVRVTDWPHLSLTPPRPAMWGSWRQAECLGTWVCPLVLVWEGSCFEGSCIWSQVCKFLCSQTLDGHSSCDVCCSVVGPGCRNLCQQVSHTSGSSEGTC